MKEFNSEEDAITYIVSTEINKQPGYTMHAVVARVDKYAIDKSDGSPGKYKDVPSVIMRLGKGKGWWE